MLSDGNIRRVGRGGVRWVRTHPPRAEKVRLKRAKDELRKRKNANDESFLIICQRTQLIYNCVHVIDLSAETNQ